jgi:hypothetical protein
MTTPAATAPQPARRTRVPDRLTDLVLVVTAVFAVWAVVLALCFVAIWITSGLAYFTGTL